MMQLLKLIYNNTKNHLVFNHYSSTNNSAHVLIYPKACIALLNDLGLDFGVSLCFLQISQKVKRSKVPPQTETGPTLGVIANPNLPTKNSLNIPPRTDND